MNRTGISARVRRLRALPAIAALLVPIAPAAGPATGMAAVPAVFAPGVVSGPAHDSAPTFTPDGTTVYFQRSSPAGATIMVSQRREDGWSAPQVASFSGRWSDLEPSLSPDGSFLVFISNRPATPGGRPIDGHYNGADHPAHGGNLWRVDRKGSGWGEPVRLPDVVNRSTSTFSTSVVADGSVYFMQPSEVSGRFRLYRSQYRDGSYQAPTPLPFTDDVLGGVDPAVAPDESFMVFGSNRKPAHDMDLFIVFRDAGRWGTPVHMGTINAKGSDAEPRLGPDQRTLYFSSERFTPIHYPRDRADAERDLARIEAWDNGQYNIWQVSLDPWLKDGVAGD